MQTNPTLSGSDLSSNLLSNENLKKVAIAGGAFLAGFYIAKNIYQNKPNSSPKVLWQLPLVSSAPGKVILFGEHAVVLGKTAIASSLGLRVYAHFEEIIDEKPTYLSLELPELGVHMSWTKHQLDGILDHEFIRNLDVSVPSMSPEFIEVMKTLLPEEDRANNDAKNKGILVFLFLYFVILSSSTKQHKQKYGKTNVPSYPPMKVTLRSFLPIGMGLGSSGSYAVALTNGLMASFNLTNPTDLKNKRNFNEMSEITTEQKNFINDWAFQAERIAHGTPSGIDNTVSTFGGTLTLKREQTKTIVKAIEKTPSLSFLLTNTKVPRNTADLVAKVRNFHETSPGQSNPILDKIDNISLSCIKEFQKENINRKELIKEIGGLMKSNHDLLCTLGVGHASLDKVCTITQKHGLNSKLTGAGGGGCALTLLGDDTSKEEIENVKKSLNDEGFDCFIAEIGGKGTQLHKPEDLKHIVQF